MLAAAAASSNSSSTLQQLAVMQVYLESHLSLSCKVHLVVSSTWLLLEQAAQQ
jgi:hypothetical protein